MQKINVLFKIEKGIRICGGYMGSNGYICDGVAYSKVLLGPVCDHAMPKMSLQDTLLMSSILSSTLAKHTYEKEKEHDVDGHEQYIYIAGFCIQDLNNNFSHKYNILFTEQSQAISDCNIDLMAVLNQRLKKYRIIENIAYSSWYNYSVGIGKEIKEKEKELEELRKAAEIKLNEQSMYTHYAQRLKGIISSDNSEYNIDLNNAIIGLSGFNYDRFNPRRNIEHLFPLDIPFSLQDRTEIEKFIRLGAREMSSCITDHKSLDVYFDALKHYVFSDNKENFDPNKTILKCYIDSASAALGWLYLDKNDQLTKPYMSRYIHINLYPLDFAFWKDDYDMIYRLIKDGAHKYSNLINEDIIHTLERIIKDYLMHNDVSSIDLNSPIIDFVFQLNLPLLPILEKRSFESVKKRTMESNYVYPLDFAIRMYDEDLVELLLRNGAYKISNLSKLDLNDDFFSEKFPILLLYFFAEMDYLDVENHNPNLVYNVTRREIFSVLEEVYSLRNSNIINISTMDKDMVIYERKFTLKQANNLKKVLVDILRTFTWDINDKYRLSHSGTSFYSKFMRAFPNYNLKLNRFC